MYIHRELIVKNVLPPLCLPTFLLDWVDINSNICVYTAMQVQKFPHAHLLADGWYLDCSRGLCQMWKNPFITTLLTLSRRWLNYRKSRKKILPFLNPLRRMLCRSRLKARVGNSSPLLLLKFLFVLTRRLPFNALFRQPPPWLEIQAPLRCRVEKSLPRKNTGFLAVISSKLRHGRLR